MTNSVLRYTSGVEATNSVRIARVAAAGRVMAAKAALRARQAEHDETCDCWREYDYCEDYPR